MDLIVGSFECNQWYHHQGGDPHFSNILTARVAHWWMQSVIKLTWLNRSRQLWRLGHRRPDSSWLPDHDECSSWPQDMPSLRTLECTFPVAGQGLIANDFDGSGGTIITILIFVMAGNKKEEERIMKGISISPHQRIPWFKEWESVIVYVIRKQMPWSVYIG